MNRIKTTNDEYSKAEFDAMGQCLKLIIKRAEKGLQYGADMPSSRDAILHDIAELADWSGWIASETLRISGGK